MSTEAELAAAGSAADLIPGDPSAFPNTVTQLRAWSDALGEAANGFNHLDSSHWKGSAAEAFRDKFAPQPAKWSQAAVAFGQAADACQQYDWSLVGAQTKAQQAIELYRTGVKTTADAKAAYDRTVTNLQNQAKAQGRLSVGVLPYFSDPGQAQRDQAVALLDQARTEARSAAQHATATLRTATENAPDKPSFLDQAVDWAQGASAITAAWGVDLAYDVYNNVIVPGVNGVLTFGNSMLHNPGGTAEMALGIYLMVMGAGAEVGGGVLDATGIGALVGVPVNIAAAGLVATGFGIAATGFTTVAADAPNNQVQVMEQRANRTAEDRRNDSGYGKTPTRSGNDPEIPPDAAPYDPEAAAQVPAWGEPGWQTTGVLVKDGEQTTIVSTENGAVQANGLGGPKTGLNGNTRSHVEAHAGASLQPGESATLYINRLPCGPGSKYGCEYLLPRYVAPGAKLTVYGPDGFARVIYGTRGLS